MCRLYIEMNISINRNRHAHAYTAQWLGGGEHAFKCDKKGTLIVNVPMIEWRLNAISEWPWSCRRKRFFHMFALNLKSKNKKPENRSSQGTLIRASKRTLTLRTRECELKKSRKNATPRIYFMLRQHTRNEPYFTFFSLFFSSFFLSHCHFGYHESSGFCTSA